MVADSSRALERAERETRAANAFEKKCFHCGSVCDRTRLEKDARDFCCQGCLAVYELLTANGLGVFYRLDPNAGVRVPNELSRGKFSYLDAAEVRQALVNYSDARETRITLRIPAIHCVACVWLLENLFRLKPGIGHAEVNFPRKELTLAFETGRLRLSEVVHFLASLGYEPEFNLADLEVKPAGATRRRPWILQLGVAGFAFGNNMLFSIALYLGLDGFSGPAFQRLTGWLSMLLALPVLLFSARDYFRLAWTGLKHRFLTIEVPIASGILVMFGQSAWEVVSGRGPGYFDSFAGLVFFLLCGRWFQRKTYDRLAFDRDYKAFFPLSARRKSSNGVETIPLSRVKRGEVLLIRNGELIPADATLLRGAGWIDYSFVTGEAEPVEKREGEHLYAGGRQIGETIEIEIVKPVSQSYLTSLWNQEAFAKPDKDALDTLINRYSPRFTRLVLAAALGSAVYWSFVQPPLALRSLAAVLIVACPCALALAAPFTLGTAIRVLGRAKVYVKNSNVIERLARIDTIVFDKTGTLTVPGGSHVSFHGAPLTLEESRCVHAVARHSTHPFSVRVAEVTESKDGVEKVRSFLETPGRGVRGNAAGREILLGSKGWLKASGIAVDAASAHDGGAVHLAIDGKYRGAFLFTSATRDAKELGRRLAGYQLALLSGDHDRERARFEALLGKGARLHFDQSPEDKLRFVRSLQAAGGKVMMVGDGLNDAGALKQSDVGVAVVENIGTFSPASDIILEGGMVPRLPEILRFSKESVRIVRLSFALSALYNVIGISIAARGMLAPVVCAILMPLSSVTVVLFACGATAWWGRRAGLERRTSRAGDLE